MAADGRVERGMDFEVDGAGGREHELDGRVEEEAEEQQLIAERNEQHADEGDKDGNEDHGEDNGTELDDEGKYGQPKYAVKVTEGGCVQFYVDKPEHEPGKGDPNEEGSAMKTTTTRSL